MVRSALRASRTVKPDVASSRRRASLDWPRPPDPFASQMTAFATWEPHIASGNPRIRPDITLTKLCPPRTRTSVTKSPRNQTSRRAGRAAPAAFLHPARHHGDRRLCLAEGRQLAGGAARPVDPRHGYPQLSRGRKRLHRKPARPHRSPAEDAGQGDARADQGRRFPRAVAGRPVRLFPQIPRGRPARNVQPHAARRRRGRDHPRRRRSSPPTTNISSSAARGIRPTTGSRPGAPTSRARNIFRSGCATGPSGKDLDDLVEETDGGVVWSADCHALLLRQARRQPPPDAGLAASARHHAGGRRPDL